MLSRLVIIFLPRSKCLLISWLQSPFAVILETKKIKSVTVSIVLPFIWHDMMRPDAKILVFWMSSFKPAFSLSSFIFIKRLLFSFYHKDGVICISEVIDISPGNLDSILCFIQPWISHELNKQIDNIQHWHIPFPIWNQSVVPYPVASWPTYRFLRRQVRWSGIPVSLRILNSLVWFIQSLWHSQKSRSRCFLEFSCFMSNFLWPHGV